MRTVGQFPRVVREIENCWITLADGCRLAARIWLPADAEEAPVPAILEYLPYRKRDGTAARDELTHPYFAGHGYACIRVDMRGNGESDGLMWDEYLQQEQDDALEVIDWITDQAWCTGKVGMIGISWGGFNGLQVAARQPEALKAIVTLCSTDDRYADDIHYKGGALLNENLGWATTMLAFSSRPPDPALVGEAWRAMWMDRLENLPLLVENWLRHPQRDAFWKHGSVCENFDAIKAAVFAVGGWGDAYSNAIPRMLAGLNAPKLGLIGPWIHKYPHFALPEPRIGFLQEALRWWDHWLKGAETGIMEEPLLRAYMMDSTLPLASYERLLGHWVSETAWPPAREPLSFALNPGELAAEAGLEEPLSHASPQDNGAACGEYCAMWCGPEWPTDQRYDDAASLTFDSAPLGEWLELLGPPRVWLELEVDRPQALVAARLCDVHPSGASTRISYGVLNLAHRESHEKPAPLTPGQRYRICLQLDDAGYSVAPGHRLRLALSTSYWPQIWPSPEAVTLTVYAGSSRLELPQRPPGDEYQGVFEEPEGAPPIAEEELRPSSAQRWHERNLATGESILRIVDDFGAQRSKTHGLESGSQVSETYRIHPDDPLSARAECRWTQTLGRGEWQIRTECRSAQWADPENFFVEAEVEAYEGDEKVFEKRWDRSIPRNFL